MEPSLSFNPYGVALIGEALGADEAAAGAPFVGRAGHRLSRLIEWAGLDRSRFDIYNTVWCRPPNNKLEGTPEESATTHCHDHHWKDLLSRSKVLVPMGNVPTGFLIGKRGITTIRGYVHGRNGQHVIPTVHPSYIQRGQSKWSAAFINDILKAVRISREGLPAQLISYHLDPSPLQAYNWARGYREALAKDPHLKLAFDIETPGKGDEDELETDSDAPDRTWNIERIGFAYSEYSALSIPYEPEYQAAIRLVLGSAGDKVVWNAGFDVPRLRRAGQSIGGTIHDGMVAWHILHTDLPKSLRFVATFTCPFQPAWKHLSGSSPAFYNATDADVELRSMNVIEAELRKTGLWEVYQKDVLDLEPILVHMHQKGMPVDQEVRLDRAVKLADSLKEVKAKMESAIPLEARRIEHIYVNTPKSTEGLLSRPSFRTIPTCAACGAERPRKDHFKRFVKKVNPCAGAGVKEARKSVEEFYRLAEFTPSREQLIRYHQVRNRPLPMVFDKKEMKRKVSFGERQLKDLSGQYPEDMLYSLILKYREIDKLAGTYVGRPIENQAI